MADSEIVPEVTSPGRWRTFDIAEQTWKSQWLGWLFLAVFLALGLYWWWFVPSTGKAGMLLAVAAAIMSARAENLKGIAMGCWILLLFGFLAVEYRAIDKDKIDSQKALTDSFKAITDQANANLKTTLDQSNTNLKAILDDEHNSFSGVLQNQQKGFLTTLTQIVTSDQKENDRFGTMLSEQQKLFNNQLEMVATLNGRLLPAGDQTPLNACSTRNIPSVPGQMFVITPHGTFINSQVRHTILEVNNKSVIAIMHQTDGSITLLANMSLSDGRVVFKLDENGVRSIPGMFLLRPNKSTVIVEDPSGAELFRARYINPNAFSIEGDAVFRGKKYAIDPSGIAMCSVNTQVDISYDSTPQ